MPFPLHWTPNPWSRLPARIIEGQEFITLQMHPVPFAASLFVLIALPVHAASLVAGARDLPFSIQDQDGIAWLTKPSGARFFSLGVCVADMGTSHEEFKPKNPGYAAWQHYLNSNRWAEATPELLT